MGTQDDEQASESGDDPGAAPAETFGCHHIGEGQRAGPGMEAERDKSHGPATIGREPAPCRRQSDFRHHSLAEQAQEIEREDEEGDRRGKGHGCRRGRQSEDIRRRDLPGRMAIEQAAQSRKRRGAGQRRRHIEQAERPVGQTEFGADLAIRQGNEEGLAEGGEEAEGEPRSQPASIRQAEPQIGHMAITFRSLAARTRLNRLVGEKSTRNSSKTVRGT